VSDYIPLEAEYELATYLMNSMRMKIQRKIGKFVFFSQEVTA